jgi:hydroxymethylbilane synthase
MGDTPKPPRPLRIGTRGSALARRQAEIVTQALRAHAPGIDIETVVVQTEGDRRAEVSLEEIGGQGVFVKDIEARLLRGEIDLAVHSLKDMPAEAPEGLTLGAVLPRGDARDALVAADGKTLAQLPDGARIGSDSKRRAVQLLALRPDVQVVSIRGNVDTRLRKVEAGEYDAAVLAAAGLERLGLLQRATQVFSVRELLPAVGQGVLALQCRSDDAEVIDLLRGVDDAETRAAVTAERAFLRTLGAGCRLPVGAYATLEGDKLRVDALLADEAGKPYRGSASGPVSAAESIGKGLAHSLRMQAGV